MSQISLSQVHVNDNRPYDYTIIQKMLAHLNLETAGLRECQIKLKRRLDAFPFFYTIHS